MLGEGFSAFKSTLAISASAQINDWTVTSPYFTSPSASFNAATGTYTVPETGRYLLQATINYSTATTISISLGAGVNPAFAIRRTAPTSNDLVSGLFPVLDVNVALLTLRAVLGNGTVTLAGEVELNSGDLIGLFYVANGLTISLTLGGAGAPGVVWSINRLT